MENEEPLQLNEDEESEYCDPSESEGSTTEDE